MGNIIQMVRISEEVSLFIIDFNEETEEMIFRTTYMPKYRQNEIVKISQDMVYTNLYHFPVFFLTQFVISNME